MAVKITPAQIPKPQPFVKDTKAMCKQWSELESCHRDMLDLTDPKSERGQMHSPGSSHLPVVWEAFAESGWELLGDWFSPSLMLLSFMAHFLVCVELKYRILLSMKIQSEGIRYSEKLRRDPKAFLPVAEDWNWVILSSSSNPNHSSTPWKTSPHGYFRRGGLGKVKLSAPILIQDAHTAELGIMCYCTSEPLLPKNELNPRI